MGRLEALQGFRRRRSRRSSGCTDAGALPPALGLGGGGRRAGGGRACGPARPRRCAATCVLAGRVDDDAAARAVRARRRVRPRHALRGVEPGHAGGHGPRPAGGGHPRRGHPRQGRATARRAGWWSRGTWTALAARLADARRDPARARGRGGARPRAGARPLLVWPVLVERTLARTRSCCRAPHEPALADGGAGSWPRLAWPSTLLVVLVTGTVVAGAAVVGPARFLLRLPRPAGRACPCRVAPGGPRLALVAAPAPDARPVPPRGRPHQRRRRHVLRLRPLALEGLRPRLHERVHPLRADRARRTCGADGAPGCAARSSRWAPALVVDPRSSRSGEGVARGAGGCSGGRRPLGLRSGPPQRGGAGQPRSTASRPCCSSTTCCAATSARAPRCWPRCSCGATTFLHWYMVQQPTMSHAPSDVHAPRWCSGSGTAARSGRTARRLPRPRAWPWASRCACAGRTACCWCSPAWSCWDGCAATGAWRGAAAARRRPRGGHARRARSRRWWPGRRSTAVGAAPTRPTAPTSCASTTRSCWRRCSPRATACSRGRRSSGPGYLGFLPLLRAAARRWRWPLLVPAAC